MGIDLADYEARTRAAVSHFWLTRSGASQKNLAGLRADYGNRGAVTGGKNMDGFIELLKAVVVANGLSEIEIGAARSLTTLPGFFRPTKNWDLLVIQQNPRRLIAAIELKSQIGSIGNNFNNRCEEALGTATDLWTAYREAAFGLDAPRPFVGYLMLLQDSEETRRRRTDDLRSPHFPIFPEFARASYAERYTLLCEKLVRERLYDAAAVLLSSEETGVNGDYDELTSNTGLLPLIAGLAGHVASAAALRSN